VVGPRHYYEIRSPFGQRLGYGLIPEAELQDSSHIPAMLSRYPEGSTFRSQFVSSDEARLVVGEIMVGDWSDVQTGNPS
jgi:hypothetical protein